MMRRGDKNTASMSFVPKLGSIRSVDCPSSSSCQNNLDISTPKKRGLFTTITEGRCRWSAATCANDNKSNSDYRNSSGNNNNNKSNNNVVFGTGNDQRSPMQRMNSTLFGTGVSRDNGAYGGHVFTRRASNGGSYNNVNITTSNSWGLDNNRGKNAVDANSNNIVVASIDKRWGGKGLFASVDAGQPLRRDMNREGGEVGSNDASLQDSSFLSSSGDTTLSFQDSAVCDIDTEPVVPAEVLSSSQSQVYSWVWHQRHSVILTLLRSCGIFPPRHKDLVDYHMSEAFLNHIDLCCQGSYFVSYKAKSLPKERFYSIRMLPRDAKARTSEKVPYLTSTVHSSGVQIMSRIPLEQLVGVTTGLRSASFRPHMVLHNVIIGPQINKHRVRMPTDGAFSLWFCDRRSNTAMSVDLITCNPIVFDVWTRTFKGLVSVNSSSVVRVLLTSGGASAELIELTKKAQLQVEKEAQEG